eukprot:3347584-Rhodomonas_salina.1
MTVVVVMMMMRRMMGPTSCNVNPFSLLSLTFVLAVATVVVANVVFVVFVDDYGDGGGDDVEFTLLQRQSILAPSFSG